MEIYKHIRTVFFASRLHFIKDDLEKFSKSIILAIEKRKAL